MLSCLLAASIVAAPLATPGELWSAAIHLALTGSTPAAGAVLESAPSSIELRFTEAVTLQFCEVVLAPFGAAEGERLSLSLASDTVLVGAATGALEPGVWELRWKAAGSDGHVVSGTVRFTVADPAEDPDSMAALSVPESEEAHSGPSMLVRSFGAMLRLGTYGALFLVCGAVAVLLLVAPRVRALGGHEPLSSVLEGMALSLGTVGGLMVAAFAWTRGFMQHAEIRGAGPLLTTFEFFAATQLGRSLVLVGVVSIVLSLAFARTRQHPGRETSRARGVVFAALALLMIFFWSSAGHASSAHVAGVDARLFLSLHVLVAGMWLGSLAVIFLTILPTAMREPGLFGELQVTIEAFSPVALAAAGLTVALGVVNSLAIMGGIGHLFDSQYGRVLLAKIILVAGVAGMGFYNWRVVRPSLDKPESVSKLRSTARLELLLATLVLIASAVLSQTPPPR